MPAPVLQFKRGNAGVAGTVPALRPGEPAISLNNFDFFIGIDTSVANNKFFGSHRYWGREDGTNSLRLKLVDKDGTNYIALKTPNTLAGNVTYTLPGTQGTSSSVLTNDGNGNLTWASGSANPVFTGIATFTDGTDNTLGNADTGAVQIDGGLGVNKNVTVGGNLNVQGYSEFVGVVTFRGGTINIGDSNTDNINVAGEFVSNLTPNTDNTYDIGIGTQRWRNANFAGVVTATTFNGSLSGNASSADQVKTVNASDTNANYYVTFVDTNNGSATNESVYTDDGIYYNPGTNTFTTQNALFTNNVTVNGTITGTATTATRATLVDTSTAPSGTFYPGLFVSATGTASTAVYVDAGISYVSNTDTLTLTGDIAVNGGDVTTSATTFNLVNSTATSVNIAGAATGVVIGATTGIATIRNATLTLPNATTVNVNGANPTLASSSTGTLTLFNTNLTSVNAFQAATNVILSATTGVTTVRNKLVVSGNLEVDGNNIQSSTGANVITLSGTDATFANNVRVTGITTTGTLVLNGTSGIGITGISASTTLAENSDAYLPTQRAVKAYVDAVDLTLGLNADTGGPSTVNTSQTLTISGTVNEVNTSVSGQTVTVGLPDSVTITTALTTPTVNATNLRANDGTNAISITNTTGAVSTNSDLTVGGNLYVNGSTTQVNTASITVEDRTIELGIVDGAAPSSSTTWDLGVLFNYNDGVAKKSALVWEQGDARFKLGSVISDSGGTGNNNPQLTVSSFAALEISDLWINNACTGGAQQVIGCVGSQLQLQNITLDAGTF